jgi:transposase-like protein
MASRISPAAKRRFFQLVQAGMAPVQAAQQVGFSSQSSWRLMKGLDEGYSMTDLGRELGVTRQAVYDLLKRAER